MPDSNFDNLAIKQGTELFREVYNKEISDETFRHKHFDNPTSLPVPYIIETQDDIPVGMRWLMRLKFLYKDQVFWGVQSSDDAVSSKARGLLFLKMRKKTLSVLKEENVDFEYGCFSPGNAMEIAVKTGENNVVNLFLARLFLNEKTHKWKRFNIVYPGIVKNTLANSRMNRLKRIAQNDLSISIDMQCSFTDDDYLTMNDTAYFHIERDQAYYQWKTACYDNLRFITARLDSKLMGFLVIQNKSGHGIVVDWDVYGKDKVAVLAAMIEPVCMDYSYLDVPSLNIENGEMKLFTDLGCKDMSSLWAPICICMKPISDNVASVAEDPIRWKHRLIDTDYFLNGD